MRFVCRAAMSLAVAGALLITLAPATTSAAPTPTPPLQKPVPVAGTPCGEHAIAVAAVKREVDAHNSAPHVFVLPAQQAASDRYNREKTEIGKRQDILIKALNDCVDFLNALDLPGDVRRPPDDFMSRAAAAIEAIPANYVEPKPALRTPDGILAPPRELLPLLGVLQAAIPDGSNPSQLPKAEKPRVGSLDPSISGANETVPANADGSPAVVPMLNATPTRLLYVDGFLKLPPQYMYFILTARANLAWATPQGVLIRSSSVIAGLSGGSQSWIDRADANGDYFATAMGNALPGLQASLDAVR